MSMTDDLPRRTRLGRAGALLAGAAVYALLVYGPLEFYWTPFLLGVAYLVAAAAGGRRGGLWATGLVLAGWGVGVLLPNELGVAVSPGDGYLIGVGAAVIVGGLLVRRGFEIGLIGVGATALAAGLIHTFAGDEIAALVKPWPYVVLLAVVGAVNLAFALAPRSSESRSTDAGPRLGSTAREPSPTT